MLLDSLNMMFMLFAVFMHIALTDSNELYKQKPRHAVKSPYFTTISDNAVACVIDCGKDRNCRLISYTSSSKTCEFGNSSTNGMIASAEAVVYHTGECESGWADIGGRCVQFQNIEVSWQGCQDHCQNLGGNSAHVYSPPDLAAIVALIPCTWGEIGCSPWLGINDMAVEGVLRGAAGQDVSSVVAAMFSYNSDNDDCSFFKTYDSPTLDLYECSFNDCCFCDKDYT